MPALASMALAMANRVGADATDAEAVGRLEGARRAVPYDASPSTLEALVSDLDRLGFDPIVADAAPRGGHPDLDDGAAVVAFANCPFARLADEQPDLVCGLHSGIVAGFVAEMGDAEVREFCTLTARTPCQVTVATR
jgi:predicted ArsR family transcriptional regulator